LCIHHLPSNANRYYLPYFHLTEFDRRLPIGPVCFRVCGAFERQTRKQPAKRSASEVRWLAARDTKREKLNWMVGNLERGPGAAFAQTRRALPTPGNKQALNFKLTQHLK